MVTGEYQEQGQEQEQYQGQEQHYAGGPYQGYGGDSDGEEMGDEMMGMMPEDGDYSMDAYGDTGYLQGAGGYYDDDPEMAGL